MDSKTKVLSNLAEYDQIDAWLARVCRQTDTGFSAPLVLKLS